MAETLKNCYFSTTFLFWQYGERSTTMLHPRPTLFFILTQDLTKIAPAGLKLAMLLPWPLKMLRL